MKFIKRTSLTACALCVQLLIAGCGIDDRNGVSKEKFDRLKMGMSYEEVITILGTVNTCDKAAGDRSCLWGDEKKNIGVQFVRGKVVFLTSHGLEKGFFPSP